MTAPYILTLDFGSTSAKCLIFDSHGEKIAQVKKMWKFSNSNLSDQTCFCDQAAWIVLANCCQDAMQESGINPREIACVIPTSQRHGAVVLDEKGEGLFSFTNSDERSSPRWEQISNQHGEQIYQETGHWPQKVFLPAHLFWLEKQLPEIRSSISKILGIQDWLVYRLSGKMVSEPTIAGDLLLMNVSKGKWSHLANDMFEIERTLLPPLVEAGTEVGKVSPRAAKATSLLVGTPVLNGAADSQMALLGAGALNPKDAVAIFGTSTPVLFLMGNPLLHPRAATWTNRHIFNDQWVLESNSGDAGLCLSNFRNMLLPSLSVDANQVAFEQTPSFLELDEMIGKIDERTNRILCSWGPMIFNGKKWPKVCGAIRGLNLLEPPAAGIADLYLSLVENIGFAVLGNLQQLSQTVGSHPEKIYIGGPVVESKIWQRTLASILGSSIMVPEEKEVTPMGAAVLAAYKLGIYKDVGSAVEHMIHLSEVDPIESSVERYKEKYQAWMQVYQFSLG